MDTYNKSITKIKDSQLQETLCESFIPDFRTADKEQTCLLVRQTLQNNKDCNCQNIWLNLFITHSRVSSPMRSPWLNLVWQKTGPVSFHSQWQSFLRLWSEEIKEN